VTQRADLMIVTEAPSPPGAHVTTARALRMRAAPQTSEDNRGLLCRVTKMSQPCISTGRTTGHKKSSVFFSSFLTFRTIFVILWSSILIMCSSFRPLFLHVK